MCSSQYGEVNQSLPGLQENKILCKIVDIFLSISLSRCFGCPGGLSHWDGSFGYSLCMFGIEIGKLVIGYTSPIHRFVQTVWVLKETLSLKRFF